MADHELYKKLNDEPGLIIFTSGTTSIPKAALHNVNTLLSSYSTTGKSLRTISFLMFDHIGGINTMLYSFFNGGCIIVPNDRNPDTIFKCVEQHKVELLPTTPTFLNMALISRVYENYDISSLKMITYGTEPMPECLLLKLNMIFPNIKFKQTYGLTELGIFQTKSVANDSLYIKIGGEGVETKVVNSILHIRSKRAMLGYLNAPNPFDAEGWYNTEDRVIVKDDTIRILGRDSKIINVGGQKVSPYEVENIILEIPNISEAVVFAMSSDILGEYPVVKIKLVEPEPLKDITRKIRDHCLSKLPKYKMPKQVFITDEYLHNVRS
jgi:acyl-CoA synthetase (AMP-forming)/AMP-acid ligase II